MEPMTLGSAPSSPSSPTLNPNFLPAFLMGDTSQPGTPNPNGTSPGRNRTPGLKLGASSTPDPRAVMYPKLFNQTLDSPKQTFTPHKPGPPSQGLFDTIEQQRKPTSPIMQSTALDSPGVFGRSRLEDSFNCTKNFNETVNLSRVDKIDTHWVTVFGFPPSALSLVLAQLSNCGVIVEKKVPTQGNWLHVKFNNLSDVPRALALNGRCISNCIMIGVSLHYNKENKENENVFATPSRARSLRHSYVSPSNNNSVLPPQNVPQKSTGLMSKAIEYVFGW